MINTHNVGLDRIFLTLKGFLIYGLKKQLFTVEEIKTWFKFESEETKEKFLEKTDELKEFEDLSVPKMPPETGVNGSSDALLEAIE